MKIDWEKLLTVKDTWVSKYLTEHIIKSDNKIVLRTYSLKFSGQKYETNHLVKFAISSIKKYVLTAKEIKDIEDRDEEAWVEAREYFGDVDPVYDGKYGELILYLLTEAILKVPLIAYKIPTNTNDQIKGGDGIFMGDYNSLPAILIGEAKTWGNLSGALDDAFKSLNKLYTEHDQTSASFEYFVAKRNLKDDMSAEELDYIYKCLTIGTDEYRNRNKVHPVLIIYDNDNIKSIDATDAVDGELKLKKIIEDSLDTYLQSLKNLCANYPEVAEVNLDFFFIPLKNVSDFKSALYKRLHGSTYRPKDKAANTPKKKAAKKKK